MRQPNRQSVSARNSIYCTVHSSDVGLQENNRTEHANKKGVSGFHFHGSYIKGAALIWSVVADHIANINSCVSLCVRALTVLDRLRLLRLLGHRRGRWKSGLE